MIKTQDFSAIELGSYGEKLAKEFLKKQGYKIVVTNFSIRLGRSFSGHPITGEIDIIAYDQEVLCFIEVKTRSTDFLAPEKAVNLAKQRQLSRVAKRYKEIFQLTNEPSRFDVIAILLTNSNVDIRLEKDFFLPISKHYYSWQRFFVRN
ncbi:MAG: putative endonuclease [bacterium]|nr:MAG: putative endonuclease [bacterium]